MRVHDCDEKADGSVCIVCGARRTWCWRCGETTLHEPYCPDDRPRQP